MLNQTRPGRASSGAKAAVVPSANSFMQARGVLVTARRTGVAGLVPRVAHWRTTEASGGRRSHIVYQLLARFDPIGTAGDTGSHAVSLLSSFMRTRKGNVAWIITRAAASMACIDTWPWSCWLHLPHDPVAGFARAFH